MSFKILTVPFEADKECFMEEELSRFCLNKKIRDWQSQFFIHEGRAYWTVFLDYDEILEAEKNNNNNFTEPEKLLYQRLRVWRKEKAEKAGVPVYIVATNGELAELVRRSPKTIESLKTIRGFGRKKIENYGRELIGLISDFYKKTA